MSCTWGPAPVSVSIKRMIVRASSLSDVKLDCLAVGRLEWDNGSWNKI